MNPFASKPETAIASLGESRLIERLKEWLGKSNPPSPYGIGDDCAVFDRPPPGCQQLVTTDPVVYGKHFDDSLSPEQVAAKLAKRNLSDIAAMGGRPKLATISLALDPDVSIIWIERFYRSLSSQALEYQFTLSGGDISNADRFLGAFLTLIGETLPDAPPLLRHASQPGSPIFVTGTLGGTRIKKHHTFSPRLKEGQWLARSGLCLSCCDLSDGIGKDYKNLLPTNLSAEIDCEQLPISEDALLTAERSGLDPLYHVFNDGEDYELLFTLTPETDPDRFISTWTETFATPLSKIGTTKNQAPSQLSLVNAPPEFSATGYEHLR